MKIKKTESSVHSRKPLGRVVSAVLGVALLGVILPVFAQQPYESAPVLSASKILPPELLSGPNHRVQERVTNDGYLNIYQIDSKFGTFTTVSTAVLRKRIGEINAMVVMEKVQGSKEYLDSIKEGGLDAMTSALSLVTKPVQTISGAVQGLGAAFTRVGEGLFGATRSQSEDSKVKDLIGFSTTKRQYAYQFDVDVYSENQKLQDMLNRISWAGYAGSLTWSTAMAAVPGGAGVAMTVIGSNKLLNQVFQNMPPVELRKMNSEKLLAMGVHPEIADAFINNSIFSPREQTLLVHALGEMNGVADRGALVRLALPSQNSTVALFRQRQAQMYAGYNKSVTPLERFVSLGQFAVSRTANGALVVNLPVDYLVWTEPMAQLLTGANQLVDTLPGTKEKQIWLGGTLSPRARKEIESRGWQIHDRAEAQLFNWVETYPDYKRPDERVPSGTVTLNLKSVALGVGGSWGEGTLTYQGRNYPFSISGLSLVDVGISNFTGAGKVYDLKSPRDLAGTYGAGQATFAVAGGASAMSMKNNNGVSIVVLKNEGQASGTQLSMGPAGMKITMR
ncbi:MAG TPA: hypothetical protein VHV54_19960 [Candidatus Binatia bacterium]|nr:hypothetical protein [Candidatus Binatia bacterium]